LYGAPGRDTAAAHANGAEQVTLGTAQRFHAKMGVIAERSGFDCNMKGFPQWRTGSGLRPAVGPLGEWEFIGGSERGEQGHLSGLAADVVLSVQLVPRGKAVRDKRLFEFEGYDAAVKDVSQHEEKTDGGKFGQKRSTEALIALLRETPEAQADILAAAFSRLMESVRQERSPAPKAFFLSVDGKDPPQQFLARFSSMRPMVRAGSEFGKERQDVRINAGTRSLYWHGASRVDVGYDYDMVPASLWWSGFCRVEKREGRWTGTEVELHKGWKSTGESTPCVVRDGHVVSVNGTNVNWPDSEKLKWIDVKDPKSIDPKLVALGHAHVDPKIGAAHSLRVDRYVAIGEYVLLCGHFEPLFPDGGFCWVVNTRDMKYMGHFLDKGAR
jgi:hypothetical protein